MSKSQIMQLYKTQLSNITKNKQPVVNVASRPQVDKINGVLVLNNPSLDINAKQKNQELINAVSGISYRDAVKRARESIGNYMNAEANNYDVVGNLIKKRLRETGKQPLQMVEDEISEFDESPVIDELNTTIQKINNSVQSGVYDISTTAELYQVLKIVETHTYKFSLPLIVKYLETFEDLIKLLEADYNPLVVERDRKALNTQQLFLNICKKIMDVLGHAVIMKDDGSPIEDVKIEMRNFVKTNRLGSIDREYSQTIAGAILTKEREIAKAKGEKKRLLMEQVELLRKMVSPDYDMLDVSFVGEEKEPEVEDYELQDPAQADAIAQQALLEQEALEKQKEDERVAREQEREREREQKRIDKELQKSLEKERKIQERQEEKQRKIIEKEKKREKKRMALEKIQKTMALEKLKQFLRENKKRLLEIASMKKEDKQAVQDVIDASSAKPEDAEAVQQVVAELKEAGATTMVDADKAIDAVIEREKLALDVDETLDEMEATLTDKPMGGAGGDSPPKPSPYKPSPYKPIILDAEDDDAEDDDEEDEGDEEEKDDDVEETKDEGVLQDKKDEEPEAEAVAKSSKLGFVSLGSGKIGKTQVRYNYKSSRGAPKSIILYRNRIDFIDNTKPLEYKLLIKEFDIDLGLKPVELKNYEDPNEEGITKQERNARMKVWDKVHDRVFDYLKTYAKFGAGNRFYIFKD
jgi:hypothetical protein